MKNKISTLKFSYRGTPHSPYSGKPAETSAGANSRDKTLLLAHYGDANVYGLVSKRVLKAVGARSVDDVEHFGPSSLVKKSGLAGSIMFVIDTGWNGINTYAWAPAEPSDENQVEK